MSPGALAEGLGPLLDRVGKPVREQEVLRVAAIIEGEDVTAAEAARREVLTWARRRCGGQLPHEAWQGKSFELFAGGRNTIGVRFESDDADLWALRGDDPDKTVAGRTWTTEVTVGVRPGRRPRLGLRLLVSTTEEELRFEPHSPGLIQQIISECGLSSGEYELKATPTIISSEQDVDSLIAMLEDPARRCPVFVASGDERSSSQDIPLIDVNSLARATAGLAHIFVLPANWTYALTDYFGKPRSVFFGAVRTYMPGFSADAHPYDHQLFLDENLRASGGAALCMRTLRSVAARESLRRTRMGHDVLTFAAVRNGAMRELQRRQITAGAPDQEKLESAEKRIEALEEQIKSAENWEKQLSDEHSEAEERAKAAEAQANASAFRIQTLLAQLNHSSDSLSTDEAIPENWADLEEWCDRNLAGTLVLTPVARRNSRRPLFQNVQLVARCLLWLSKECRDRRIGGGGSISEEHIEDGIRNAACGGDAFDFDWQGRKLSADWHVKNGGNSRNPARCLRIYYGWDADTQQIVVADLPAHRRTGAT